MNNPKVIQLRQRHSTPGPEAGDRLWAQGDVEGAVEVWLEVLHTAPALLEVRLGLAAAMCVLGRWEEAARELSVCLPFCTERADVLVKLAICHLQRDDLAYARMLLEQALHLEPDHRLGRAAWLKAQKPSQEEGDESVLVWDDAQDSLRGSRLCVTGLPKDVLEDIVLLEPGNSEALNMLARLEEEDGNPGWAQRYLERAIEANPLDWSPHYHLGRLNVWSGDREWAKELMERAVLLNPKSLEATWLMAQLAPPPQAAFWFERAYALDPDNPAVCASLAALAVQAGNPQQAEEWIAKAYELSPENREYAYNYGLALYRRGEIERARELWQKAQASLALAALAFLDGDLEACSAHLTNEPVTAGHLLLGQALLNQEQYAAAASHYLSAGELNPELLEAWVNAGAALQSAGKEMEAREAWKTAMNLDPTLAKEYFG